MITHFTASMIGRSIHRNISTDLFTFDFVNEVDIAKVELRLVRNDFCMVLYVFDCC